MQTSEPRDDERRDDETDDDLDSLWWDIGEPVGQGRDEALCGGKN